MRKPHHLHRWALVAVCLALVTAGSAIAATVTISVPAANVTAAAPGGSAKAKVVASDNSAVISSTWTQVDGVPVTVAGVSADTATFALPDRATYKKEVYTILEESPVDAKKLPSWIPAPSAYSGGLQERYTVAGVSPEALIGASTATFNVSATTSSGTYTTTAAVALADLPWATQIGQRNVPINVPVLLHGPAQATFNWGLDLSNAPGSKATLTDATTQNPEFTPDVNGLYNVTVTDIATNKTVVVTVAAGKWKGIITGQDASGRPTTDVSCNNCHVGNAAVFGLWAQTGHAEIFTQNVSAAGHYSQSCLECHTVGFSATPKNNTGITDQSDWAGLAGSGLIEHGASVNWSQILTSYPNSARMANIQCENCHGPQDSPGHGSTGMRQSLSSEMCGSCHGEPPRHGRYQQWQLSGHANYELAGEEGTDPTCGKCHSAQGFVKWQNNNFSTANLVVDWTTNDVHPQTCGACHDPHDIGTTSSSAATNAKVRVMGNTPALMAGFTANDVGRGATCMTCHNGRRGLYDDAHPNRNDMSRAPHAGPQADIVMGQNLFFAKVGTRGYHGTVADTCVNCHMEQTAVPASTGIALAGVGTNHTFYADPAMCSGCHTSAVTAAKVQAQVSGKVDTLHTQFNSAMVATLQAQIRAGNSINFNNLKTVNTASFITAVNLVDSHGRQSIDVNFSDGTSLPAVSLNTVKVVRPGGSSVEIYAVADPNLPKAGWNYCMIESDKSKGVHNPAFVNSALDLSLFATSQIIANNGASAGSGSGNNTAIGGGPGNGAGAMACKSAYVYWIEVAGHAPGVAGSQWRTDVVTRNLASNVANVQFFLHQASGNLQGTGTVVASGQYTFEDIVATLGGTNNLGSLEICSDQPLLATGRIYNAAQNGTFGQNIDGSVADIGFTAGQTVSLIGLRQKTDLYRSNISVTNSGTADASVSISLFDASGNALKTYTLPVPAGLEVQDTEPFKNRAGAPDVDWGYATVTVVSGANIHTSASLIDNKTNDPTTVAQQP